MNSNRGIAIVTVLSIIALLMVMGVAASYLVTNESIFTKNVKDSKLALAAAQAGAQRALARFLNNNQNINFQGYVDGAYYSVTYQKVAENGLEQTWEITSYGVYNGASKKVTVQIVVEEQVPFRPFASDGEFSVNSINIPNSFDSLLEIWAAQGFNIDNAIGVDEDDINNLSYGQSLTVDKWNVKFVHEDAPTPSVKAVSVNISDYADECDVGDSAFSSNVNISSVSLVDSNGDGQIVVCGNQVNIDKSVAIGADKFVVLANNINVDDKIDEYGPNPVFDVVLFAQNDVVFGDDAEVEHHGKSDTYNITVYAGNQIISDADHFIHVTGFSTAEEQANILLVAGNGIDAPDANIHYTGKESNNLLIWSDGDITLGKWHATGSSGDEVRKVGIIAHSDDPTLDPSNIEFTEKIHITGSHHMEGLTVEDIQNWYNSLPDDDPTKAILAGLLQQIANSGSSAAPILKQLDYWRVE